MKKIAVFGKPANGKSTLSRQLASATGIPLYPLDSILYQPDGQEVDREVYEQTHEDILRSEQWIIEGFGPLNSLKSFHQRLAEADTLIYIDLPYATTYWLVTKRMFKGLFKKPEGWPEGSSIVRGTIESFKVLKLCPRFWNEQFLERVERLAENKTLHLIQSVRELDAFVDRHAPRNIE